MSTAIPGKSTSEFPPWWRTGLNYAVAVARYVAAGAPHVSPSDYLERMQICSECPLCRSGRCLICGCNVEAKAQMATETCLRDPSRWPKLSCKK